MTRKVYGPFTPYDQLRDRVMELWVRGVRQLPLPKEGWETSGQEKRSSSVVDPQTEVTLSKSKEHAESAGFQAQSLGALEDCRQCPVCPPPDGSGVFYMAPPANRGEAVSVPFLVVLDQPFEGESLSDDLASEKSPNHLIQRLLTRAGLLPRTHIVYALRSRLTSRPPLDKWVRMCATHWLAAEVDTLTPQVVLAFGARATLALQSLFPAQLLALGSGEEAVVENRGRPLRVLFLPGSLELQVFPSWRQEVWERVSIVAGRGSAQTRD